MGPVNKPTGFISNSWAVLEALDKRCNDESHDHVHLVGGRASGTAIYPPELCAAICRGISRQLRSDKKVGLSLVAKDSSELSENW